MIKINNFIGSNDNLKIVEQRGIFTIFQHNTDMSVNRIEAQEKYFMQQMSVVPKQVAITLQDNAIRLKPGLMQFMFGNIQQTSGVIGVGDLMGRLVKSKMTGDTPIKPLYRGSGILVTEPSYYFPIIEDAREWGGIVCDDGMFIACDDEVKDNVVMRSNLSSAAFGGEGLCNLCLEGKGVVVLNSPCPKDELYEIVLQNDVVKIDGNHAVCWSKSLDFTVEKSGKSLIGSAASGEGLVNVYRGTGKILMSPLR